MKEIVLISGKGGTGKTSFTAAFASLAAREGKVVFADCDVDAADLHLIFNPAIREKNEFISGHVARVVQKEKGAQGLGQKGASCIELCRFDAMHLTAEGSLEIDEPSCEGCGVCVRFCQESAINFVERRCGDWFISDTRFGTLVHAALDARAENSGKLVSTVRKEAKRLAVEENASYIIVDGSPGIGCPVIASITGADAVVIVTEPTMSGQHDLERVASLARHFSIPFYVCINKADINPEEAGKTEQWCIRNSIPFLAKVPYDRAFTQAQIHAQSVIEYSETNEQSDSSAHDISNIITTMWKNICQLTV